MAMFNQTNLCERASSGFLKILEAVKEYRWKAPDIEENQSLDFVKVTIWIESIGECRRISESIGNYQYKKKRY